MGLSVPSSLTASLHPSAETPDILQRDESVGNTTDNHNVLLMHSEMASEE
jgi:hypothetical protein